MPPDFKPSPKSSVPALPPVSLEEDEEIETLNSGEAQDSQWQPDVADNTGDAEWPPFPTISQSMDASALSNSKRVDLRPRLGKDYKSDRSLDPLPRERSTVHLAAAPQVTENVALQFNCPACLQWLQVAQDSAHVHVACPACQAVIAPPRIVQATAALASGPPRDTVSQAAEKKDASIFRPSREQLNVRFIRQSSKKGKSDSDSSGNHAY